MGAITYEARVPKDLVFGDKVGVENFPDILSPVIDKSCQIYKAAHGDNLKSVFVTGSVARGDWSNGTSDLDLMAITHDRVDEAAQEAARLEFRAYEACQPFLAYIDAATRAYVDFEAGIRPNNALTLRASGVCVWGDAIDFSPFVLDRRQSQDAFVHFYREHLGRYDKELESDCDKTRRAAKFCIRTLAAAAVLNGAPLYTGIDKQLEAIKIFIPAHAELGLKAFRLISNNSNDLPASIAYLEQALAVYDSLYSINRIITS